MKLQKFDGFICFQTMKFYFLWAKNVNVKSFINLLAYLFFIMNLLFFMASAEARKHHRKSTERFECTSGN